MVDVESVREDMQILAGRWELSVIASLQRGACGHAELTRVVGTEGKQLTRVLRRLQRRGLIARRVEVEAPPVRVRYSLTQLGERLLLATAAFANWKQPEGLEGNRRPGQLME